MAPSSLEEASARLRALVARRSDGSPVDQQYLEILAARDEVLARFRPMFRAENLSRLTAEAFREFLVFRNNKHWMALQRMGPYVTADMARLREALSLLVDESIPIESRLETLVPTRGPAFVPRLGKAILTPVLLIHDPTRYGVWNRVSEDAMRRLGIFPDIDDVPGFGDRYRRVNDRLVELAGSAAVDQWTLDALWWRLLNLEAGSEALPVDDDDGDRDGEVAPATGGSQRFGLERHLHEFLRDNWSHTELGSEWKLYEKDGDSDAGYEFITDIGRIDLLAKHVTKPSWLVVELKRNHSSDKTVGQVLRYMGWVREHLAGPDEAVEGLIVAHQADASVRYALSSVHGVRVKLYEVDFRFRDPSGPSKR